MSSNPPYPPFPKGKGCLLSITIVKVIRGPPLFSVSFGDPAFRPMLGASILRGWDRVGLRALCTSSPHFVIQALNPQFTRPSPSTCAHLLVSAPSHSTYRKSGRPVGLLAVAGDVRNNTVRVGPEHNSAFTYRGVFHPAGHGLDLFRRSRSVPASPRAVASPPGRPHPKSAK